MSDQIRTRRSTATEWALADPILALGEIGIETDDPVAPRMKIGDGATQWSSLPYVTAQDRLRWRGEWVSGTAYEENDVVRDGFWTMVCTASGGDETERPGPQVVGDANYIYQGQLDEVATSPTRQLIFGQRYTFGDAEALVGYRVFTYPGLRYQVYAQDRLSGNLTYLVSYVATVAGWVEFPVDPVLILSPGQELDLGVMVTDPSEVSTHFVGPWSYRKPRNDEEPNDGEVRHSNTSPELINIAKLDNTDTDRGAELLSLVVGDIVQSQGVRWFVQQVDDNITYVTYHVQPAAQARSQGVQTFEFFQSTGTPLNYGEDADAWTGNPNMRGLFSISGYLNLLETDAQYGIDLKIAGVSASPNWDAMAGSFAAPFTPNV